MDFSKNKYYNYNLIKCGTNNYNININEAYVELLALLYHTIFITKYFY